jgi:hypothetical protein
MMAMVSINFFDGRTLTITRRQVYALRRIYKRGLHDATNLRDFISLAQPTIGCDGMVAIPYGAMWLAVEADGYVHS